MRRLGIWAALAVFLAIWNGYAASFASPFHLLHASDSTQYHLLVRNRLHGHYEVGDGAHTVRTEGMHPVWRPGLVWIEELLARELGSVATSAAVAAAVGTTLLELLLLWLTAECFGMGSVAVALVFLLAPLPSANIFLQMAVGMGAEPWASAALVAGLGILAVALRQRSWSLVIVAGIVAGLSECFRTGNHLLFAVPCAAYGLLALGRRDVKSFFQPAVAGVAFLAVIAGSGRLVPSAVDKTTMNLWHRQLEFYGEKIPNIEGSNVALHLGGLQLAEDAPEDYYDYSVPRSKGVPAWSYFLEHRERIVPIYVHGLREIFAGGATGLREMVGNLVFVLFLIQVISSIFIRSEASVHSLALGGGALAHYLIPTALLRGDEPTHYLYVAVALFVAVAAAGAVRVLHWAWSLVASASPSLASRLTAARAFGVVTVAAPLFCLTALYYFGAIQMLRADAEQARVEQADLDRLPLQGKRVCCRNMNWFVDRDVVTAFFPYCDVPGLERYVRGQQLDGLLLWEHERHLMFRLTPYGSLDRFEEALRGSSVFGPPESSGAWRWYPVRKGENARQAAEKKPTLEHPFPPRGRLAG